MTVIAQGDISGTALLAGAFTPGASLHNMDYLILNGTPNAITLRSLTTRAEASAWHPLGLALLGPAAVLIICKRRG